MIGYKLQYSKIKCNISIQIYDRLVIGSLSDFIERWRFPLCAIYYFFKDSKHNFGDFADKRVLRYIKSLRSIGTIYR